MIHSVLLSQLFLVAVTLLWGFLQLLCLQPVYFPHLYFLVLPKCQTHVTYPFHMDFTHVLVCLEHSSTFIQAIPSPGSLKHSVAHQTGLLSQKLRVSLDPIFFFTVTKSCDCCFVPHAYSSKGQHPLGCPLPLPAFCFYFNTQLKNASL